MRVALIFCLLLSGYCGMALVWVWQELQMLKREVRSLVEVKYPPLENSDPLRR